MVGEEHLPHLMVLKLLEETGSSPVGTAIWVVSSSGQSI